MCVRSELVDRVVADLTRTTAEFARTRPVYLLGESFGGILALAVAMRLPRTVHRVVLVNPATSYPRSPWPALGPRLTQLPDEVRLIKSRQDGNTRSTLPMHNVRAARVRSRQA
jgi:pimeloyl-ACP methyl ester carboxylesterase